jgi:hypothetical protein
MQSGHRKKVHAHPKRRARGPDLFQQGQKAIDIEVVVDQKAPWRAKIIKDVDIGQSPFRLQNVDDGQNDGPSGAKGLTKFSSVHFLPLLQIFCALPAVLAQASAGVRESDAGGLNDLNK